MHRLRILPIFTCFLFLGCWQGNYRDDENSRTANSEPTKLPKNLPPAATETASRVYTIGQEILAKNPQLPVRPLFTTIGSKEETVFHSGNAQVYISEGLVRKLKTDGELSAVLCLELGKMISEREGQLSKQDHREADRPLLPPRMPDVAGSSMGADMTQQAEMARFQQQNPRRNTGVMPPPPNPEFLAKGYLTRAGYNADELTRVQSLLRNAEMNPTFEKQLNLGGAASGLGIPSPAEKK